MIFEKKRAGFIIVLMFAAVLAFSQAVVNSDEPLYILFPSNSADLKGVSKEIAIRNAQVFTKVAQLLLENTDYRILVDGHANPVEKTRKEENSSLRPLSVRRAEATASFLATYYGVDRQRLVLTGAGGGYPFGDADEASNRRVSFFVIPPK